MAGGLDSWNYLDDIAIHNKFSFHNNPIMVPSQHLKLSDNLHYCLVPEWIYGEVHS